MLDHVRTSLPVRTQPGSSHPAAKAEKKAPFKVRVQHAEVPDSSPEAIYNLREQVKEIKLFIDKVLQNPFQFSDTLFQACLAIKEGQVILDIATPDTPPSEDSDLVNTVIMKDVYKKGSDIERGQPFSKQLHGFTDRGGGDVKPTITLACLEPDFFLEYLPLIIAHESQHALGHTICTKLDSCFNEHLRPVANGMLDELNAFCVEIDQLKPEIADIEFGRTHYPPSSDPVLISGHITGVMPPKPISIPVKFKNERHEKITKMIIEQYPHFKKTFFEQGSAAQKALLSIIENFDVTNLKGVNLINSPRIDALVRTIDTLPKTAGLGEVTRILQSISEACESLSSSDAEYLLSPHAQPFWTGLEKVSARLESINQQLNASNPFQDEDFGFQLPPIREKLHAKIDEKLALGRHLFEGSQ